nr:immunoglobulin heavy chain junction region [Mus musculus]MBK4196713.1 immunoglobulin heavy chain junction region [Mus musculus]
CASITTVVAPYWYFDVW